MDPCDIYRRPTRLLRTLDQRNTTSLDRKEQWWDEMREGYQTSRILQDRQNWLIALPDYRYLGPCKKKGEWLWGAIVGPEDRATRGPEGGIAAGPGDRAPMGPEGALSHGGLFSGLKLKMKFALLGFDFLGTSGPFIPFIFSFLEWECLSYNCPKLYFRSR